MAKLTILEFPDPRLRTKAVRVDSVDDELRSLIDDLFETMYAAPGIGLAATQVDVHRRLLVTDVSADKSEPYALINPEILEKDGVIDTIGRERLREYIHEAVEAVKSSETRINKGS